ncbi:hypothetical protein ES703_84576 [subsurface metagenome]
MHSDGLCRYVPHTVDQAFVLSSLVARDLPAPPADATPVYQAPLERLLECLIPLATRVLYKLYNSFLLLVILFLAFAEFQSPALADNILGYLFYACVEIAAVILEFQQGRCLEWQRYKIVLLKPGLLFLELRTLRLLLFLLCSFQNRYREKPFCRVNIGRSGSPALIVFIFWFLFYRWHHCLLKPGYITQLSSCLGSGSFFFFPSTSLSNGFGAGFFFGFFPLSSFASSSSFIPR